MTASATWRRWSAVRIELAELLAEQERQHRKEAAQRFRRMIAAKVAQLRAGKPGHEVSGAAAWRVRRLEQEARRLSAKIRTQPAAGTADVLARLDVIAAMWGPDGSIAEPGAPLADMLALLEEIARSAPGFQPMWRRCRRIAQTAEEAQPRCRA